MNTDINLFTSSIREKTGISLSIYDMNGRLISGANGFVTKIPLDFENVVVDTIKDLTFFNIKIKGKRFIACLFGSGEEQKNYAYLIAELAENYFSKETGLTRAEFLRSVLIGEINYLQTARYKKKFALEDAPAFVMLATVNNKSISEVQILLKTYVNAHSGEVVALDDSSLAIIKFIDDEIDAYQSFTEYAEFLVRLVYEEMGARIKITIGGVVNTVSGLTASYQQALTASRVSASVGSRGSVHSFKEYVLIKMLEDMPKHKLGEYLDMLMDANAREIFDDSEMVSTAEEFLENSLNMSETSRKLYLHRNTLAYRLDKIEKATGLNVRKFSEAVTFRLITTLSKLIK